MTDIILLGQIPGTSIQISFWAWLIIISALATIVLAWRTYVISRSKVQFGILYVSLLRSKLLAHQSHSTGL